MMSVCRIAKRKTRDAWCLEPPGGLSQDESGFMMTLLACSLASFIIHYIKRKHPDN